MQHKNLTILGGADERTLNQALTCLAAEEGSRGVLLPDNHLGYSQPVGMAAAYRDHISVSGVGFDIGCGNLACRTDLQAEDIDVYNVMDRVFDEISFGIGRKNNVPVEHPVLDDIRESGLPEARNLYDKAAAQLGTVGAGNHYVDLFVGEDGALWVGVHFGSRGFGHSLASGFMRVANGGTYDDKSSAPVEKEEPSLLRSDSEAGQAYLEAMNLAGDYAYAGRDVVVRQVLDILGANNIYEVHNHHNFAWPENHNGDHFWVVRKGCTPAFEGQEGFVGSTMGEPSVILTGTQEAESTTLASTVHGAGRAMSRTQAAGKIKKRWSCCNRDCEWTQPPDTHKPPACPDCGHSKLQKRFVQVSQGEVDWEYEQRSLSDSGIELRGGAADEAPPAYKRLSRVLDDAGSTIQVLERLYPIGVAMAPSDTQDPYKD